MKRTLAAIALTVLSATSSAITMTDLDASLNAAQQAADALQANRNPTLTDKQWADIDTMLNALQGAEGFAAASRCVPYNSKLNELRRIDVIIVALKYARENAVSGKILLERFKNTSHVVGLSVAHFYNCGPEDGSNNPNKALPAPRAPNTTRPGTLL